MLKQNLGFGLVMSISVVASGLFAACGGESDDPGMDTQPSTTGTSTGTSTMTATGSTTSMPTMTTTSTPTMTTTSMPTMTMTAMPTETMPTTTAEPPPAGDAVMGKTQYSSSGCNACHGTTGEGGLIGPNITGSMTAGMGGWSYADFEAAVRAGTDPRGGTLCASMTKYPESLISADVMANLYAFLMAEMNDTVAMGACPGVQ